MESQYWETKKRKYKIVSRAEYELTRVQNNNNPVFSNLFLPQIHLKYLLETEILVKTLIPCASSPKNLFLRDHSQW